MAGEVLTHVLSIERIMKCESSAWSIVFAAVPSRCRDIIWKTTNSSNEPCSRAHTQHPQSLRYVPLSSVGTWSSLPSISPNLASSWSVLYAVNRSHTSSSASPESGPWSLGAPCGHKRQHWAVQISPVGGRSKRGLVASPPLQCPTPHSH